MSIFGEGGFQSTLAQKFHLFGIGNSGGGLKITGNEFGGGVQTTLRDAREGWSGWWENSRNPVAQIYQQGQRFVRFWESPMKHLGLKPPDLDMSGTTDTPELNAMRKKFGGTFGESQVKLQSGLIRDKTQGAVGMRAGGKK